MINPSSVMPRPGFTVTGILSSLEFGFAEVVQVNQKTVIRGVHDKYVVTEIRQKRGQIATLEDVMPATKSKPKPKAKKKSKNPVTRSVRRILIEEVNAEVRKLLQHMIDIIDNDPINDFEPILKQWEGSFGRKPPNGKGEIIICTGLVREGDSYRLAKASEMEDIHE